MIYAILISLQLVQILVVYLYYRRHFAEAPLTKAENKAIQDLAIYPDEANGKLYISIGVGGRTAPVVVIDMDDEMTLRRTPRFFSIGVIRAVVTKGLPPFEF